MHDLKIASALRTSCFVTSQLDTPARMRIVTCDDAYPRRTMRLTSGFRLGDFALGVLSHVVGNSSDKWLIGVSHVTCMVTSSGIKTLTLCWLQLLSRKQHD